MAVLAAHTAARRDAQHDHDHDHTYVRWHAASAGRADAHQAARLRRRRTSAHAHSDTATDGHAHPHAAGSADGHVHPCHADADQHAADWQLMKGSACLTARPRSFAAVASDRAPGVGLYPLTLALP